MGKRIYIFGPSGVGCTSTGKLLATKLGTDDNPSLMIDTDKYYWVPSYPPFKMGRSDEETIDLLRRDMNRSDNWVLTGAICGWGDTFITNPGFDLVVYLYADTETRLKRIEKRERERLKEAILPGGESHELYKDFVYRASHYDIWGPERKSRSQHETWMEKLKCPILRIEDNDISEEKRVERILAKIKELELVEKQSHDNASAMHKINTHCENVNSKLISIG